MLEVYIQNLNLHEDLPDPSFTLLTNDKARSLVGCGIGFRVLLGVYAQNLEFSMRICQTHRLRC
jgi:hypothetical protein